MFDLTTSYTPEEIALILDMRSLDIEWAVIRLKLIEAGYRDRSVDGLKRALYRRRDGYTELPQRDRHHRDEVDASERRREADRLVRSDENFCKALERERPRTGANVTAGTDRPMPLARDVVLRSPYGWPW